MTSANAAGLWTNLYQTIARANLALKYTPSVTMLAADKNSYLAEAYAVRALCYFYIVRVWGDAPLFTSPVENYSPEEIYRERTDKNVLLNQIVSDLEMAETYAQPLNSADFKRTRVNIMTVYALMMDAYAWMHQYDKVTAVMEKVNALAASKGYWKTFTIASDATQESFTKEWQAIFTRVNPEGALSDINKERIFYLYYEEIENGLNGNTSYFCTGACKAYPTDRLLGMYTGGDKRLAATYSGNPKRLMAKFWGKETSFGVGGQISNGDLILYRMSDLVLLYAEALAQSGRMSEAIAQLNIIRTRSGLSAYVESDFITPEQLVKAVLDERTKELIGEGKFWFDLVRTGHATDIGGVEDPAKYLFPINKKHLDENHKLRQNSAYGSGE